MESPWAAIVLTARAKAWFWIHRIKVAMLCPQASVTQGMPQGANELSIAHGLRCTCVPWTGAVVIAQQCHPNAQRFGVTGGFFPGRAQFAAEVVGACGAGVIDDGLSTITINTDGRT